MLITSTADICQGKTKHLLGIGTADTAFLHSRVDLLHLLQHCYSSVVDVLLVDDVLLDDTALLGL